MKILILGAGSTGASVAEALAGEENDIVVVDFKVDLLEALKERFDIATVAGNAAHPSILEQAGISNMDMVIAVTDRDETNMRTKNISIGNSNKLSKQNSGLPDNILHNESLTPVASVDSGDIEFCASEDISPPFTVILLKHVLCSIFLLFT